MFDAESFLEDHGIRFWTQGKNCQEGWVNINCPFCMDDPSNHGGFNIQDGYYKCWRCGHQFLDTAIIKLLDVTKKEAKKIIKKYSGEVEESEKEEIAKKEFFLPPEAKALSNIHKKYLEMRNFDPDYLEKEYRLLGTKHLGDYKFRLIAPIFWEGKIVSFQGRDVTNKSDLRYKNCPLDREIIPMKNIAYNLEKAEDKIIIVEGIFDVWRLGKGAISLFGVSFTQNQVKMLAMAIKTTFKRVLVCFDSEDDAQIKAEKLCWELSGFGAKVENITLPPGNDPADISPDDAEWMMQELGFRKKTLL